MKKVVSPQDYMTTGDECAVHSPPNLLMCWNLRRLRLRLGGKEKKERARGFAELTICMFLGHGVRS